MSSDIAETFSVSILVSPEFQNKPVSGAINNVGLDQALDILEFLAGAAVTPGGEGLYYIGGAEVTSLHSWPSYGLNVEEIQQVFPDSMTVVRDQLMVETSQSRAKQLGDVLDKMADRARILLELYILDVGETEFHRVNEYISAIEATGTLTLDSAARGVSWGYLGELAASVEMQDRGSGNRVLLRQTLEMVSGSSVTLETTDIIERPVFLRQEQTDNDLVTQFDQRRIGLQVELEPAVFNGTEWHLDYSISDSTLEGTVERRTQIQGQRVFDSGQLWAVIATTSRQQKVNRETSPLGLKIKWLTRKRTEWVKRNLVIMVRIVQPPAGATAIRDLKEIE